MHAQICNRHIRNHEDCYTVYKCKLYGNGPSVQRGPVGMFMGRGCGPDILGRRFELPIVAGRARDQLDYVKVGYISSPAETMRGL